MNHPPGSPRPTVVLDIDGTICFDGATVEHDILAALDQICETHTLAFASARPLRDLLPVLPERFHKSTLIGGNGAFLRHEGATHIIGLSDEQRKFIDAVIDDHKIPYLIDGEWDYSYTGDSSHRIFRQIDAGKLATNVRRELIDTYSKVVLFTRDADIISGLLEHNLAVNVHAEEGIVDVAPTGVTKYAALERSALNRSRYVAYGNDVNDVIMLQHAAVSYRVGENPILDFANHTIRPDQVALSISSLAAGGNV